jgi:hypothetical protein
MTSYGLSERYNDLLKTLESNSIDDTIQLLINHLPYIWIGDYELRSNRLTDIRTIKYGSFHYIFDDYNSFESKGIIPCDSEAEGRTVGVIGISSPQKKKRDDYRLKGWIGKTEQVFGREWDKGHFIAHSLGGAVDSIEVNVFPQKRDLNRGWSDRGKIFRRMENYCFENIGTLCFNRPIYLHKDSRPDFLEFGLLNRERQFWVEIFDNR